MTTATRETRPDKAGAGPNLVQRLVETLLTQRIWLLAVLIVILLIVMTSLDAAGMLRGSYNSDYLAASLINAVPLTMLALAQLFVIVSGRGGIDLSVGSMVSMTGIAFGLSYGAWGWSLLASLIFAVLVGALLGTINGVLVAYLGFPPLIATLATYYAYDSLALVWSGQKPVNSEEIQAFYSAAKAIELPVIGQYIPLFPVGIFTFLVPTIVISWVLLNKTTFGRRVYALGTNDTAALWSGVDIRSNRMTAYILSGVISGLVGIVTVAQFASARPDAGNSGSGMALPSITIAVLGGVAITGGIGRVAGVVLAALLIVWLNAGILLAFPGNLGVQFQLLALGVVLIFAALLNSLTRRKYGGAVA